MSDPNEIRDLTFDFYHYSPIAKMNIMAHAVYVQNERSKNPDLRVKSLLKQINKTSIGSTKKAEDAKKLALQQNKSLKLKIKLKRDIISYDIDEEIKVLEEIKALMEECFKIYDNFESDTRSGVDLSEGLEIRKTGKNSLLGILYELVLFQRDLGTTFNIKVDKTDQVIGRNILNFKRADEKHQTECIKNLREYLRQFQEDIRDSNKESEYVSVITLLIMNLRDLEKEFRDKYNTFNIGEQFFENIRISLGNIRDIKNNDINKAKDIIRNFNDEGLAAI